MATVPGTRCDWRASWLASWPVFMRKEQTGEDSEVAAGFLLVCLNLSVTCIFSMLHVRTGFSA